MPSGLGLTYPQASSPAFFVPRRLRNALLDDGRYTNTTGVVTPVANLALYHPITLETVVSITKFFWTNGTTATGNVDVGLYTADGTKVGTSTGSVAQSGTSAQQSAAPSGGTFIAGPGRYYVAVQCDASTANLFQGVTIVAQAGRAMGLLQQAVGSFGLPASATFAAISQVYLIDCGIIADAFPGNYRNVQPTTLTPWSFLSGGGALAALNAGMLQGASAAWPTANLAFYFPVQISSPTVLTQAFVYAGTTSSNANHFDIGLYTADGTKVMSTGSTAWSGSTSVLNVVNITDTVVGPGLYYLALALDTNTDHVFRVAGTVPIGGAIGQLQQATAFALPASATFAAIANAYIPIFGYTTAATI